MAVLVPYADSAEFELQPAVEGGFQKRLEFAYFMHRNSVLAECLRKTRVLRNATIPI